MIYFIITGYSYVFIRLIYILQDYRIMIKLQNYIYIMIQYNYIFYSFKLACFGLLLIYKYTKLMFLLTFLSKSYLYHSLRWN